MGKGRVEAFSDGVIAIIITIMVLELKVPAGDDLAALRHLLRFGIQHKNQSLHIIKSKLHFITTHRTDLIFPGR